MLSVFVSLQSCIAWHSIYECHRCHATFNKKKKLRKTKYIFIIWITRLFTFCPDEMEIGAVRRGFELSKHGRRKYIKAYSKASSPVLRAYDSSRENVKTTNTRCVFLSLSLSHSEKSVKCFFSYCVLRSVVILTAFQSVCSFHFWKCVTWMILTRRVNDSFELKCLPTQTFYRLYDGTVGDCWFVSLGPKTIIYFIPFDMDCGVMTLCIKKIDIHFCFK